MDAGAISFLIRLSFLLFHILVVVRIDFAFVTFFFGFISFKIFPFGVDFAFGGIPFRSASPKRFPLPEAGFSNFPDS